MLSLEELVAQKLKDAALTVVTAESCTAGKLASALAEMPGAGSFFAGGFVAYQKRAKMRLLGVDQSMLEGPGGAVTSDVAEQMAEGARARANTDFALATTGVAGPDEDEDGNPVGMVFIALATSDGVKSRQFRFPGSPEDVCKNTIDAAMIMLAGALGATIQK